MKHHFTNFGLFALLIALLAVPLTGLYMFNYQVADEGKYLVPEYVPINVLNGQTDVLSETDARLNATEIDNSTTDEGVLNVDEFNVTESSPEFNPGNYIPANQ